MAVSARGPVVIVLASGKGRRFVASGGTGPKLQAMLAGRTVLDRTLAAVRTSGLAWHLVDAGHSGMGVSIAAGVRATADAPAWLILPGDLPLIRASTLQYIAAAPAGLDIVVPFAQGHRGHPVRFSAACGDDLMKLSSGQGALAVMAGRTVTCWAVDDAGINFDIDTLDDLRRAEQFLQAK